MRAVLDHTHDEAANIRTFFFRPEAAMKYTAGQFTELYLPHKNPDDRGQKRWFTLSSSPSEELVTITTKYAGDDKSSSFKRTLFGLQPGTEVTLADAMGAFVLPKLIQTPLLFVAGGIGITPFHSMLEWLASVREERPIQLLYGVRVEDEIVFLDTFERAKVHPTIIVGEPEAAWGGERGNLSAELILGLGKPSDDTLIYLSGPEVMIQNLQKQLQKAGVAREQIVTDEFPNYDAI